MKTTKKNSIGNWSLVIGLLLLCVGQMRAVDYQGMYKGTMYDVQSSEYKVRIIATMPIVGFESTSAYSKQWQQQTPEQSSLNADGTVNVEKYMAGYPKASGGVRKAPNGPGTPGGDLDPHTQQPIGDGLWVLLLFALAYAVVRTNRTLKLKKNIQLMVILALTACTPQEAKAVTFDPTVRYSKEVINARMTNWKNKSSAVGFPNANSTNGSTSPGTAASWDYVPGVVAKGILDCWEYYQTESWADAWYEGLSTWASGKNAPTSGGSLDDLNCTKVFFGLYDGAKPGGKFENSTKASNYMTQMERGATGLAAHKSSYSISGTGTTADGGWYHKSSYGNQMWCDGAYMGPALLAQLLAYGVSTTLTWSDVMTQFTSSWGGLWDSSKELLWHCFSTDKSSGGANGWVYEVGQVAQGGGYHSAEYWGRADGWYIMALVDVLEAMEKAGKKNDADFLVIQGYLKQLAVGLVKRQDATTGCWYQLLQYDNTKCATKGTDATGSSSSSNSSTQCNYLESSGSCLITGALLKGLRLGYLNNTESGQNIQAAAKNGYEGIIAQFLTGSAGSYQLTSSCQSAGLGSDRNGSAAYYLIGKDVTIQNDSEGKVLGAFLMAAVEYERKYLPLGASASGSECKCLRISGN